MSTTSPNALLVFPKFSPPLLRGTLGRLSYSAVLMKPRAAEITVIAWAEEAVSATGDVVKIDKPRTNDWSPTRLSSFHSFSDF
jgi:hypothetical protein